MNLATILVLVPLITGALTALCPGPTSQGLNPVCTCNNGQCPYNSYCFQNNVYFRSLCCPNYNAYVDRNSQYQSYPRYNSNYGASNNNINNNYQTNTNNNVYRNIPQAVENQIASNTVLIYGRSTCKYCQAAKRTMKQYDGRIPYTVIEYDYLPNGNQLINYVVQKTGQNTVPQVFICGQFVGGATQLQLLSSTGQVVERASRCNSGYGTNQQVQQRNSVVMNKQPNYATNQNRVNGPSVGALPSQILAPLPFLPKPTEMTASNNPNAIRLEFPGGYINKVVSDQVIKRTGSYTVPQIFVCGQYLGGADSLERFHSSGQLKQIFERCISNTVYGNRAPNRNIGNQRRKRRLTPQPTAARKNPTVLNRRS